MHEEVTQRACWVENPTSPQALRLKRWVINPSYSVIERGFVLLVLAFLSASKTGQGRMIIFGLALNFIMCSYAHASRFGGVIMRIKRKGRLKVFRRPETLFYLRDCVIRFGADSYPNRLYRQSCRAGYDRWTHQRLAAAGKFQIGIIRLDGRGHYFEAVPLGVVADLPRQRLHAVLPRLQAEFGGKSAAAFGRPKPFARRAAGEISLGSAAEKGAGGKERHNAGERELVVGFFMLVLSGCAESAVWSALGAEVSAIRAFSAGFYGLMA